MSFGRLLGELGVVVAPGLGAVAAADQEEVLDLPRLDRVDHLVGDAEDGVVAEADQDRLLRASSAKPGAARAASMTGVEVAVRRCA